MGQDIHFLNIKHLSLLYSSHDTYSCWSLKVKFLTISEVGEREDSKVWFPCSVWSIFFLETSIQKVSLIPKLKLKLYNLLMLHLVYGFNVCAVAWMSACPYNFLLLLFPASVLSLLIVTEDCICLTFCSAKITSVLSYSPKPESDSWSR